MEKITRGHLGVLKSLYKGQTRKKMNHEIFEGQFRALKCLGKFNCLNDFMF